MGCCLFASVLAGAPRLAILIYWLMVPIRFQTAFTTWIWPFIGFLFLPWTTLMYVIVAPTGSVSGFGWVWLGLAVAIDIGTYTGGGVSNKRRTA